MALSPESPVLAAISMCCSLTKQRSGRLRRERKEWRGASPRHPRQRSSLCLRKKSPHQTSRYDTHARVPVRCPIAFLPSRLCRGSLPDCIVTPVRWERASHTTGELRGVTEGSWPATWRNGAPPPHTISPPNVWYSTPAWCSTKDGCNAAFGGLSRADRRTRR